MDKAMTTTVDNLEKRKQKDTARAAKYGISGCSTRKEKTNQLPTDYDVQTRVLRFSVDHFFDCKW